MRLAGCPSPATRPTASSVSNGARRPQTCTCAASASSPGIGPRWSPFPAGRRRTASARRRDCAGHPRRRRRSSPASAAAPESLVVQLDQLLERSGEPSPGAASASTHVGRPGSPRPTVAAVQGVSGSERSGPAVRSTPCSRSVGPSLLNLIETSTRPVHPAPCRAADGRRPARPARRPCGAGRRAGAVPLDQRPNLGQHLDRAVRPPSGPGGSTPRRHSACRQSSSSTPASRSRSIRSPTLHFSNASSSTGQRVGRVVLLEADPDVQPLPQEALEPGGSAARSGRSDRCPSGCRAGSGAGRNGGAGPRAAGAPPAPRPARPGRSVNGPAGRARRARRLRASKGCNGCRTSDLAPSRLTRRGPGGVVQGVEQLAERHRRRPARARAFVGAGVGDDQLLGGGQHRVQHQLPVLGPRIPLAHRRVRGR